MEEEADMVLQEVKADEEDEGKVTQVMEEEEEEPLPEYRHMAPPSSLTYSEPKRDLPTSPEYEGVAAGSPVMEVEEWLGC